MPVPVDVIETEALSLLQEQRSRFVDRLLVSSGTSQSGNRLGLNTLTGAKRASPQVKRIGFAEPMRWRALEQRCTLLRYAEHCSTHQAVITAASPRSTSPPIYRRRRARLRLRRSRRRTPARVATAECAVMATAPPVGGPRGSACCSWRASLTRPRGAECRCRKNYMEQLGCCAKTHVCRMSFLAFGVHCSA